jgi:hypothetical protein
VDAPRTPETFDMSCSAIQASTTSGDLFQSMIVLRIGRIAPDGWR